MQGVTLATANKSWQRKVIVHADRNLLISSKRTS